MLFQAGRDVRIDGDVAVRAVPPAPAMESLSAPPGSGRLPVVSASFVGRESELACLDAATKGPGGRAVVVVVVVAVHGLGGVGKSTLAARFGEQHSHRFAPVWWITADSQGALETGLAELAVMLAPQIVDLPLEQRVELAVRWLASHDGWLVVLDNLTGPGDAAVLFERVRTGTMVITTRRTGGWAGATTVAVDVLPEVEAVELLTRVARAQWPDADLAAAELLCAELGWLPLAIEQAAAYLAQARITPAVYLELLGRFPAKMFTTTAEGGDAQRSAARVWRVTLDRLTDTPRAGDLLRRLAWFAPDAIPRHLLTGDVPDPDVLEALGRLAAYSMITLTADTIGVHRLVQAVARTADPDDPHRRPDEIAHARETATAALTTAITDADPRLPADWPAFQTVLPHARALLDHAHPDGDNSLLADLANAIGVYLNDQGDSTTAVNLHIRAVHVCERLLGHEHPKTLTSRSNLADAHHSADELDLAIPMYEATLADRERVLGPDHPETLHSRSNLAGAYVGAGELERAIQLYEATLATAERVLGPRNRLTKRIRSYLKR